MFDYFCVGCGKQKPKNAKRGMICLYCGGDLRGEAPGITGTKDGFGISKSFIDERSGKEIDTWPKWEKAGYRNVEVKNHTLNEQIKEGVKKRKHRGDRRLQNSSLPL